MNFWRFLIPLVSLVVLPGLAYADLFVDPLRGNDANDGKSPESAFRSILKARDTIRAGKLNENLKQDLHVFLRADATNSTKRSTSMPGTRAPTGTTWFTRPTKTKRR